MGAAIQAGILAREVHDVLLLDVTPLSLGVETLGGVLTKLIDRNTTIPTRKTEVFTTPADGQTEVEIHVLQGERQMAQDNRSLGRFRLAGIPPAPRGVPKIEVSFDIDANGILQVTARDMATGNKQEITISGASTLERNEVERMVREAEQHATEDKERRDHIEVRNQAEQLAYNAERSLKDLGDKVASSDREEAERAIEATRKALEGDDMDRLRSSMEDLQRVLARITEAAYQRTAAGPAGAATAAGPTEGERPEGEGGEDVIDAEFRESE
jgi:molecular chaperone DnaK